jgi:hypothetical protein
MMDIDIVTREVSDALELPLDKICYIGGGRQYCKKVAFNCLGEVMHKECVSDPVIRSFYIKRVKSLQREYRILKEFNCESPELEIYEKNGVIICKQGSETVAIISY